MRRIHYISGILLTAFIGIHLANHLWAFAGEAQHIALMDFLRKIYRNPILEALLLLAVIAQVVTGLAQVRRNWRTVTDPWERIQIWSGLYLAFFLLLHTSAVLSGRFILQLDTNFYFGAAGLNSFPFLLFFIPYYFLAVLSVAGHLAAVHSRKMKASVLGLSPRQQSIGILVMGGLMAMLVLAAMTKGFHGVEIPQEYDLMGGK